MKYVFGVMVLLTLCGAGTAGSCYTYPSRTVQSYPASALYPVTYYQPPAQFSFGYQPDQTETVLKALEIIDRQGQREAALHADNVQMLKALIASGGTGPEALRNAVLPPHPGQVLARQDCAKCHSSEDKALKGKGYVLFAGGKFSGTAEDLGEMLDQVEAGKMPRDHPWTGEQKFQFASWVRRIPPDQLKPSQKAETLSAPGKIEPERNYP